MFLHASPNLYKDFLGEKKEGATVPPPLDFKQEAKTIKAALKDPELSVCFKSKVATKENFTQMLQNVPKVLHISCHGIRNEPHTMRLNFDEVREEGHLLLFENSYGAGELVSAKQLRLIMNSAKHDFDVVFVAACDSEDIGRIFQRCGAKHVVCVE